MTRISEKNIACILLLIALINITPVLHSQSKNYYIDAWTGSDTNSGFSAALAWRTLDKINNFTFQPGDSLLLKAGCVWTGQLKPKGSGDSLLPIVISSYGDSGKARIDGNGIVGEATVYLFNQQYWEITNLEVTNDAADTGADRRGVLIAAGNFGMVHHIYLKNLTIHNVKGLVGQEDRNKRTAGIGIETTVDNLAPTRFDDILIEGCEIYQTQNTGLYTDNLSVRNDYPRTEAWYKRCFTNVRIRNNRIHHIAKNAMIIRLFNKGVVEGNVCYETALAATGNTIYSISTDGTIFQYNEGYLNRSPGADGSMYDADLRSPNTIWQYSYSHDNAHGLMWFCTDPADTGIIVRYNISQNDKGRLVAFRYDFSGAHVYNNVFYIGSNLSPEIIHEKSGGVQTYQYFNNIIYNNSTTAVYTWANASRTIMNNTFYGMHPANEPTGNNNDRVNPTFVNPGKGTLGFASLDGYKLKSESPCINSGFMSYSQPVYDFWNNPVPSQGAVDRGAFEYNPSTGKANEDKPRRVEQLKYGCFPNPCNPQTKFVFELPERQSIKLGIYNIQGENIRTLTDGIISAGNHSVIWNGMDDAGRRVSSGVYFARLKTDLEIRTIKMVMLQ